MYFAAKLPRPIVASINKLELVETENPSLEERCRELLLNFLEITK